MKKLLYVAAALTLMVNVANAQKKEKVPPGPLDKKTYVVDFTADNKKNAVAVKQELKFAMGKFSWKTMIQDGYKATPYEATCDSTSSPASCTFSVEVPGDKDIVYKWDGTITGDDIEGTAAIVKKGKQKSSYTFSGALKGKKPKKE
jgi:hypothetical protein